MNPAREIMGLFDFLGFKTIEISPPDTVARLYAADEADVPRVVSEIQGGYTEDHGSYILKVFQTATRDQKEKLIQYLAARSSKHSLRLLQDFLQFFLEEDSVLRSHLVEIYPVVGQDFIDILVRRLNREDIDPRIREGINDIITKSGLVQQLSTEYQGASKRRRLKILEQLSELQNPESYDLLFEILREEKKDSDAEEKRPYQKELVKLLPKFRDDSFLNFFVTRVHLLDASVLYEVFSTLRVFGRVFYEKLLKNLVEQNTTFQHKCLSIMARILDEECYGVLFDTFFGNPNQAIEEVTEEILGKLLKKFADRFERAPRDDPAILELRDHFVMVPLEKKLRDEKEERTLFMCEHIIRFGLIWEEVLMRNLPFMVKKHLKYIMNLFKALPEETRVRFFIAGLLFKEINTGVAVLDLVSSSTQNYHKEIMPGFMKEGFPRALPDLQFRMVEKMLEEDSVLTAYLEATLNSVDTEKKNRLLEILGQIDSARAWSFVKNRLTDPSAKIRNKILDLLAASQYDNTQVVIMLISFFKDTDDAIIVRAIEILSDRNHAAILASFSKMLTHKSETVKEAARHGMVVVTKRKYYASFNQLAPEMKYQVGLSILNMDPDFLEEVARDIGHSEDPRHRQLCARVLEVLAEHLTSELQVHLIVAIKDPDPNVRAAVIMGLGRVGGPAIVNMLLEYLKDQDDRVRANTVEAFGFIGDQEKIPEILPALSDPHNRVRANAIITLWKLGYSNVFETIGTMLSSEDKWMRASAVFAMGEIRDMRFANFLAMCLKDRDEDVRRNAIRALQKLHPTQFVGIFQQMRFDQSETVRKEIQAIFDQLKHPKK